MTVIVETPSGLQYQTVVWAFDTGGRVAVDDDARWLHTATNEHTT